MRDVYDRLTLNNTKRAREKLAWLAKKKKKGKLRGEDIDKAMKDVLCYGSLAYCCGADKVCGFRDSLLETIGMTEEQYRYYKEGCEGLLWMYLDYKKLI